MFRTSSYLAIALSIAAITSIPAAGSSSRSIASQCASNIPALAAGIDELLPAVQLSPDDMTKVTELRQMIRDLSTDGKVAAARNAEEVAMYYLGYQKIWLTCGFGTFAWAQTPDSDTAQSGNQSGNQSRNQSMAQFK